jgi:hypothetical protein
MHIAKTQVTCTEASSFGEPCMFNDVKFCFPTSSHLSANDKVCTYQQVPFSNMPKDKLHKIVRPFYQIAPIKGTRLVMEQQTRLQLQRPQQVDCPNASPLPSVKYESTGIFGCFEKHRIDHRIGENATHMQPFKLHTHTIHL